MDPEYEERAGPSSGAIRTKDGEGGLSGGVKAGIVGPVKAACTFCRSRKSRCNGKQPCSACINRGRTDDCVFTISRRGGKPKPKGDKLEPLEAHLEKLFGLSDLPHLVRIPNVMPHLQQFQDQSNDFDAFQKMDPMAVLSPTTPSNQPAFGYHQGTLASSAAPTQAASDLGGAPSSKMLIGDFYTHIYRFVPILPLSHHLDTLAALIQPSSPLLFSLRCVVPVLRNQPLLPRGQQAVSEEAKKDAVRAEAQFYAKQAYEAIDDVLERVENEQGEGDEFSIIEVIQALCILVIYEYGSGRALKSRLKVDAALTLAMSRGLHRLSSNSRQATDAASRSIPTGSTPHYLSRIPDDELFEMKKRLWWTLWMLAMWTAYNTGRIPTVRADDSRVTSELPGCPGSPINLWSNVVSSLQGLLLVQDRVLALTHMENGRIPVDGSTAGSATAEAAFQLSSPSSASDRTSAYSGGVPPSTFSGQPTLLSREDILRSMSELDAAMQEQMRILEQTTQGIVGPPYGQASQVDPMEDETQRILKFLWAIQVYTTSMTLHIGQAFQGASLFERKLCFLSSISEANDAAACQVPMPNAFDGEGGRYAVEPISMAPEQDLYARGPFLPRDSLARCVDASDKLLSISRNLRRSEGHMASPNPFNACSFVLISFVCLMQALAISSNAVQEGDLGALMGGAVDPSAMQAQQPSSVAQSSLATSNLLRSAQGAAALTPTTLNGHAGQQPLSSTTLLSSMQANSRQMQLQQIWARVKEAKEALQGLSTYWDMVIPMREEVSGCLEASQFLLSSQQPM